MKPKISVHSLLRWMERNYKFDLVSLRSKCMRDMKLTTIPSDSCFIHYLDRKLGPQLSFMRDELAEVVGYRQDTFVYEGMKIVIRDNTIITVHKM